jgi:hypothetical protein
MECLNDADIDTLRRIADHYGFSCSRHSKMEMLQEVLLSFRNPRFLRRHLAEWRRGREFPLLRLCLAADRPLTGEEVRGLFASSGSGDILEEATNEGWLFATTRIDGRRLFVLPSELKRTMQDELVESVLAPVERTPEGPIVFAEEGYALSHDLDIFLEYVDHHAVLLTQDGAMYKRNLLQILELLEIPEAPLAGGWRFGYGRRFHDYPDRFALIYDFAYHAHYIEESTDGYLRIGPERERWLQMGALDRQQALLRFYLSLYRRPISRLPLLTQLIGRAQPHWILSESMFQALDPLINEYYYDTKQQVWETRVVKMLTHLGILRSGNDDLGRRWFQITKLGQELLTPDAIPESENRVGDEQRVLIVQPNFEILVTADNPRLTAVLAAFADLKQGGALRIYRMTRSSLERAAKEGDSLSSWLSFLAKHSQTPIPGNVERTLREWERDLLQSGQRAANGERSLGS